jgi:hypothetical protein
MEVSLSGNEDEIRAAKNTIHAAAQSMLAGQLSYIEGARAIIAASFASKLDEHDPDLLPFVGIISETDALPIGAADRANWQTSALQALQPEIDRKEAWARQFGEAHCRNLAERFSN